jgi:hypothetical protein
MKKRTPLALLAAAFAFTATSHAAVIFSDVFSGASGDNLHDTTTDEGGKTWTANALFRANGSYSTTNNQNDFGAALDLGANFFANQLALSRNKVIMTLTFGATGNSNSFAYAGFSTDSWIAATTTATVSEFNVGARAQGQGITLGVERDTIAPNSSNIFRDTADGDGTMTPVRDVLSTTVSSSYTLTLEAIGINGYANSTVTLTDGTNTTFITGYDASALRTFYLGVEANTGTSTANFDSVKLEAIPEPATALLGSLGVLVLLRRRR